MLIRNGRVEETQYNPVFLLDRVLGCPILYEIDPRLLSILAFHLFQTTAMCVTSISLEPIVTSVRIATQITKLLVSAGHSHPYTLSAFSPLRKSFPRARCGLRTFYPPVLVHPSGSGRGREHVLVCAEALRRGSSWESWEDRPRRRWRPHGRIAPENFRRGPGEGSYWHV